MMFYRYEKRLRNMYGLYYQPSIDGKRYFEEFKYLHMHQLHYWQKHSGLGDPVMQIMIC